MNRKRNNQLIIRLTDKEFAEFNKKMNEAESESRADFVMALVREKPVLIIQPFREIAVELKREGNNFNQALKRMNRTQERIPPWDMKNALDKLGKLYDRISVMLDEVT